MITERYALETPLEQGRFGTIYRAADRRLGASTTHGDLAVWVLPPEFVTDGPALAAFKRDLDEVRTLSHPNIAPVLDVDHDGKTLMVATDLGDAETLRSVLDALRPEWVDLDEADAVVEAIGAALMHAHEHGIAHGDVRPENVLVSGDNHVKLANFMLGGLARSTFFAPTPGDDTRALALLAYELYSGAPLPLRPDMPLKLGKQIPRRRVRAIEAALADGRIGVSVAEFLATAGLAYEGPRLRVVHSARRSTPVVASRSRLAFPAAFVVAIGVGLYAIDGTPWAATAMAGLRELIATGPGDDVRPAQAETRAAPAPHEATAKAGNEVAGGEPRSAALAALAVPSTNDASRDAANEGGASAPTRGGNVSDDDDEAAYGHASPKKRDPKPSASPPAVAASSVPRVALSAASFTAYESQGVVTITIVCDAAASQPVDVIWWTSDGTAHAKDDYASFGRRVESLRPGETVRKVHIPLASDQLTEELEYFYVHLDPKARNARIEDSATAKINIIDDDL